MRKNFLSRCAFALLFFAGWACSTDNETPLPAAPPAEAVEALRIDPGPTQLSAADAACVSTLFMRQGNPSPATRSFFASKTAEETFPVCGESGDTLAFAVNFVDGGFVVVSATKTYAPILAFSDEGRLSPEGLRGNGIAFWTACMTADIAASKAAFSADAPACAEVRSLWRDYERSEPIAPAAVTSGTAYDWYMQNRSRLMGEIGHCTVLDRSEFYRQMMLYGVVPNSDAMEANYREKDRVLAIRYAGQPSVPPAFIWGEGVVGSGWSSQTKIMPLLRTYWHQYWPYNLLLEPANTQDGHKLAGCDAIAVAQIVNYHRYPAALDGTPIDWTQTQKESAYDFDTEIQKLVKVVNVGLKTINGDNASSSTLGHSQDFLKRNDYIVFKYTSGIESTVIDEIKAGRPVYIRGSDAEGGHAWVCDGYYSDDQTRKIYSYELMDTYPGTFSSDPYRSVFSSTRNVNLGKFFHANWGWKEYWTIDKQDPANLTQESEGWFRSVLNMKNHTRNVQILTINPKK